MSGEYRKPITTKEDKILWLMNNQDKWIKWPPSHFGVTWEMKKELVNFMRDAGLYSKGTRPSDLTGIHNLIVEARKRMRKQSNQLEQRCQL